MEISHSDVKNIASNTVQLVSILLSYTSARHGWLKLKPYVNALQKYMLFEKFANKFQPSFSFAKSLYKVS